MKAAVLHGKADLRYEEIKTPVPGPGEVVIAVKAVGICGSDIPRVLGDAAHFYPIVLGHEFSGVIHAIGKNVAGLRLGQRATAAPLMPCGTCLDCKTGRFALCRHYKFVGSSAFGAFADYVKVPAENVVVFSDTVSFEHAAFFEPATVARHGLKCARFAGSETVAVLGGGTVGLFTMQWAKLLGGKRVVVFDINDARLALAKKMGADETINTTSSGFMDQARACAPDGYAYVFETAGQNTTMAMAFELASNRASVCFIGTSSKDLSFGWKLFEQMNRKEFTLTGSWMSYSAPFPGKEWTDTAAYFADGQLRFDRDLIFRTFPMNRAQEAFALFYDRAAVGGKVLLVNE